MCGIFGIVAKKYNNYDEEFLRKILRDLALYSESRGKDSSGLAFRNTKEKEINVIKGAIPISELLKKKPVKDEINKNVHFYSKGTSNDTIDIFTAFGHSRLVTNGTQLDEGNNQPVVKDGLVGIHNGIIVNVNELWENHSNLERKYDIDTEVMLSIIRNYLNSGNNTIVAFSKALKEILGTVAMALVFNDRNQFLLGTNNGSLYYLTDFDKILLFASERFILESVLKKSNLSNRIENLELNQMKSNNGMIISLDNLQFQEFNLLSSEKETIPIDNLSNENFKIEVTTVKNSKNERSVILDVDKFSSESLNFAKTNILEFNIDRIKELRRCTKCVLPETFPFIKFDEKGVCNYCNNYIPRNQPKPIEELQKLVEPYRKKNEEIDCLVPFSGGRDSTYVLHYVKNVLHLNPITFTYDWGMVTDLARRNIARVCGKLGVENIIVAADIKKKRKYIRENINAWLKRPALGMIPLFMVGDKYFFKYANQVKKQNNIKLQIWGINFLENTDFKVGFAGVVPEWEKKMIYSMNIEQQLKLFGFVFGNLLLNPSYLNSSVIDTLGSFISRYFNPRKDYYHFFDYHQWDETKIERVLFEEYDWEVAKDLKSTWRIGDGTASFYNYIYCTVAGFSEFDTFRSNQIREGMITRDEALTSVYEENRPRYETLRWYLEIVDLDFDQVIKRINSIPKLY